LEHTLKYSKSANAFLRASRAERNALLTTLIETIESNEEVDEEIPVGAILQGAILQAR
jgi:hypothetical protein